jgi:hypothetical protein
MSDFKDLLIKFDSTLRKYNPKNYERLQPPLSGQEIIHFLDQLQLTDPDVKELFKWKNGVDVSKGLNKRHKIFDFGVLLPLEAIVDSTKNYPHEKPGLIELVGDSSGDFLRFNNERDASYGKIYVDSVSLLSIDDPYSYYDSLSSMLKTTIEAYETAIYQYDNDKNILEVDWDRCWELSKDLNPGSNYWLQV